EGLVVVITVDGEEYAQYPLKSGSTKEITVDVHNKVIIDDGVVWMEEADCPDKLCINQGKISKAGQTIICLPNRVMVTIKGGNIQYDGVAK
ncbi:MAG: NusG domain II-containing protein, partial [Lachnospiraceae bacterium]